MRCALLSAHTWLNGSRPLCPSAFAGGVLSRCSKPARSPATQRRVGSAALTAQGLGVTDANGKQVQQSNQARQLLRAILRECTYLPDVRTREYISQHALDRFRRYSFKAWKHRDEPDFDERLQRKHLEAWKASRLLKRANQGERKPLLRVLLMTYGRIGRRRMELLRPLLPIAGREETEKLLRDEAITEVIVEVEQEETKGLKSAEKRSDQTPSVATCGHNVMQSTASKISERASDPNSGKSEHLSPALYALAKTQMSASPPDLTRPNPRQLKPEIPEHNSRLRPLAHARVRNLTKIWYAELLDRLLPPLPTGEWHRLHRLAMGDGIMQHTITPSRRPRADSPNTSQATNALEMVVMRARGIVDRAVFGNTKTHAITPRSMQRLYAQVFAQCPLMEWDSERSRWNVTWGLHALHADGRSQVAMKSGTPERLENSRANKPSQ